ncbi:MAG: ATP-dependent helicase, partial [Lachnospiraceae bacterium]|nr:ATP-dependent helicase [Lachnospiraceae bacterium]
MFDYGNANESQKQAISAADGPVLITAGPGTGKTYTLVQRTLFLIQECGVSPENIFIATFTEKAAKELITRITNELASQDIVVNINEMYIGTFHSLCLRMLKEHLEYTRLKRNYRLLDTFDQKYTVFQNIRDFRNVEGFDSIFSNGGAWRQSEDICNYVNNLSEELVSPEELQHDDEAKIIALGKVLEVYQKMLNENNLMDFSSIQTEAYRLLTENQDILKEMQEKITHIMVDEYQDTNYIQERLVFLLAGERKNICVVGDDDQGLYRFRGATIRNILEFPKKFADGECRMIKLVVNYRSNSDIVDFYNEWMNTTNGTKFKFSWGQFRYNKRIEPYKKTMLDSPAVVKLAGIEDEDEWHKKILTFITDLKKSGKLKDYNQIAFLFNSVKHRRVTALARFLEENHINVYSPRSDMFFERDEIRIALGCFMLMFPRYVQGLENGDYIFLQQEHITYYRNCIVMANEYVTKPENKEFLRWLRNRGKIHIGLQGTTDYAYSGLLYQMFEFEPFATILDVELDAGVVDVRPSRNLAKLTQIINKFEYLHRVDVLNGIYININTERLFNLYLRLIYDGGISEYEDDAEYAPSGCVSFLTIHQSKGMEFPIVFVDSLGNVPRKQSNDLMLLIEERYFKRSAFEPYDRIKFFDFWRLYYTAFLRAQDLLILTC